jgi:hypothetical protein
MIAGEVQKQAKLAGIEAKPLRAARERLGIKPVKSGFTGGWEWALVKHQADEGAQDAPTCPPEKEGTFGGEGHLGNESAAEAGPEPDREIF